MKTASLTYPTQHLIDTAPMAARYAVLGRAVLTFLAAGQFRKMVRCSQSVLRLVRVFTRIEAQNILLGRKRAMLRDTPWRDRVLSDLGGTRKLEAWEAAHERSLSRIETKSAPYFSGDEDVTQPWLYTPERLAESERLKAHARGCMRATANPRVVRDRVKMDFDGLFRLAPVPRGKERTRRVKVYTQNSISDYVWNAVPYAKVEGFGPASVWPAEFYAAMEMEVKILETRSASTLPSIPAQRFGKNARAGIQSPRSGSWVPNQVWDEREFKNKPAIPLHQSLLIKTWRYLFEDPV